MDDSVQNIRRDVALVQLCIDLATGKDIATQLDKLKEFVLASEKFAFTVMDNIMSELRKLYSAKPEDVFSNFAGYLRKLGLDTKLDIDGLTNALRFFDSDTDNCGDISETVELFKVASTTTYTGAWRAIRLEMLRDMLMTLISWRSVSKYSELVASLIDELGQISDKDIEELGTYNTGFLRGTAD